MTNHYQSEERKGVAEGNLYTEHDLALKADTPLVDSGTGGKASIRSFYFEWDKKITPALIEQAKNNQQEFFNSHANYIKSVLWKDGWFPKENNNPKIVFGKKGYIIIIACETKGMVIEKPFTLQELMGLHNKKKKK